MPPLFEWQPREAGVNWMVKKERLHHDLTIENDEYKAEEQEHFHGVFVKQMNPEGEKGDSSKR